MPSPAVTSATSAPCIRFDGVRLVRGSRTVFDGLTLALTERRIGLIGDNGAGKTSLLRLIAGLDAPERGRVAVHGLDTQADRPRLPQQVGLLFQNPDDQIIFSTVVEELAFSLAARGEKRATARLRARAFLQSRGLESWADRAISELSQGQRQRVCLAALDIGEPSVLLLDEPYSALDLPSQARLSARLRTSGQQILLSTHVLEHVHDFDRVIWLEQGRVRGDGPARQTCEAYADEVRARSHRHEDIHA